MSKRIIFCPRCGAILKKNDDECYNCGTHISHDKLNASDLDLNSVSTEKRRAEIEQKVKLVDNISQAKREQLLKQSNINQTSDASENYDDSFSKSRLKKIQKNKNVVNKKKQKKIHSYNKPELFSTFKNEDGSISVDVRDVSFLPKDETSLKPSKYKIPEKLKWHEIAKWADRMLARRKIKKVVKRAATEIPEEISKSTLLMLCVFFGYLGVHNFYARNWIRGSIILSCFILSIIILSVDVLRLAVGVSLGGGFGFVFLFCWILDLVYILLNKYRFRDSKIKFINSLDFNTRAILGRKYILKEIRENELYEQSKS